MIEIITEDINRKVNHCFLCIEDTDAEFNHIKWSAYKGIDKNAIYVLVENTKSDFKKLAMEQYDGELRGRENHLNFHEMDIVLKLQDYLHKKFADEF